MGRSLLVLAGYGLGGRSQVFDELGNHTPRGIADNDLLHVKMAALRHVRCRGGSGTNIVGQICSSDQAHSR